MGGLKGLMFERMRRPLPPAVRGSLGSVKIALDLGAWVVAIVAATLVRLQLAVANVPGLAVARAIAISLVAQLTAGMISGLYRGRWRYGSFDETAALARTTAIATLFVFVCELPFGPRTPLSALLVGGVIAILLMAGIRYTWRAVSDIRRRPDPEEVQRLIILGAGDRGSNMVSELLTAPHSPYSPVALLDDDPAKRRLSIRGVKVQGTREDIALIAREYRATALLVAISNVPAELMNEIITSAEKCRPPLQVKVLAPLAGLFHEDAQAIQDLTEEDLLGRRRVETDLGAIAGYVSGKRVLVTGAGGSIGSELCRQLARFSPAALLMLDRDESALHGVQLSIEGKALLDSDNMILADLRDRGRIREVFAQHRPHVVFHAAALKHLPLLETYPAEAVKSNVWGTETVLEAALEFEVERFVNISTDKAADPVSVLGYSKRLAERLTAHAAKRATTGIYASVRFGNVLGSRGSVLTTFRQQIAEGKPITVTHPEVTRYFMLVSEAVQLVIQAGAIARPGEALVLDMGEPVNIAEVAKALVRRSGKDLSITYTGMRNGEKMHEILLGSDEQDVRPLHPLIVQTPVPPLSPIDASGLDVSAPPVTIIDAMERLCLAPAART
jgi:FlaA1/EpsC-like NDP-sugar epimerase